MTAEGQEVLTGLPDEIGAMKRLYGLGWDAKRVARFVSANARLAR